MSYYVIWRVLYGYTVTPPGLLRREPAVLHQAGPHPGLGALVGCRDFGQAAPGIEAGKQLSIFILGPGFSGL